VIKILELLLVFAAWLFSHRKLAIWRHFSSPQWRHIPEKVQ